MDIQGEKRAGLNPALSPYVAYVQYVQKNISKYIIHDLVSQSRVTACRRSFISTLDGLDTARLILAGEGCEPRGIASLLITGFYLFQRMPFVLAFHQIINLLESLILVCYNWFE